MNHRLFLLLLSLSCCLLQCRQAEAFLFDIDADVFVGYRQDRITTLIEGFGGSSSGSENFLLDDHLKAKHIHIYEIGAKAELKILNGVFARGWTDCGKVYDGRYENRGTTAAGSESLIKAKIDKGYTRDYSVSIGYWMNFIPFCNCIGISPLIGWSDHLQQIKMKHAKTDNYPNDILDGLEYRTTWKGPWLGLEAQASLCGFSLLAGYEYHFPHWRAKWLLDGPDVFGESYSDRRKANSGYGQVVYAEAHYVLCSGLDIGFGVKYQEWEAKNGREVPLAGSFAAVGLPDTDVDKISSTTWESIGIQLFLGYQF